MVTRISAINYDFPRNVKLLENMKEVEVLNFNNAYESECNHADFHRNSSSTRHSHGLITSKKNMFYDSKKLSKRNKQPNIEMREKLLANMPKTLLNSMTKNFSNHFNIDELPCSKEGGKWIMIRMYQERARRREARRKRQRQKEREESQGRKSRKRKSRKRSKSKKQRKGRKRSKSKKQRKGRKRSKSRSRSKSRGRRKSRRKSRSRSRRKSKSGSRRRSRSGSRRRSANSTTNRRRG